MFRAHKSFVALVIIVVLSLSLLSCFNFNVVLATTVSQTKTISSLGYDSSIECTTASYAVAQSNVSGSNIISSESYMRIWQQQALTDYTVSRSYLYFDTSSIPSGAVITGAILGLDVFANFSSVDFNLTIQSSSSSTYPHTPATLNDYYAGWYSGNGGSRSISELSGYGYWNISLNTAALNWINTAGTTKLVVRSQDDIDGNYLGTESVYFYSAESGESTAPKLYVTYTVTGTSYIFHGSYLESGSVFNGVVNLTVNYLYQEPETYLLNSTSGTVADLTVVASNPISSVNWNISSDMAYKRTYVFDTAVSGGEVWLVVPDVASSLETVSVYGVSVADLAGLTNPYVEVTKNINGYTRIIERQKFDPINAMPFYLVNFHQYTLRVVSNEGSWSFNLPADAVTSKSFAVTRDMLTQAFAGYNFTITVSRPSSTNITVVCSDISGDTSLIVSSIVHYDSGVWVTDYTQTDYGGYQSFSYTVDASLNYYVNTTAIVNGESLNWVKAVPKLLSSAVQFDLTNGFNLFGSWPIAARNILGMVIVLVFFGIGSFKDSEFFAAVAAIVALFLYAIGLLVIPVAGISAALVVVVWMYIHKGKSEAREV